MIPNPGALGHVTLAMSSKRRPPGTRDLSGHLAVMAQLGRFCRMGARFALAENTRTSTIQISAFTMTSLFSRRLIRLRYMAIPQKFFRQPIFPPRRWLTTVYSLSALSGIKTPVARAKPQFISSIWRTTRFHECGFREKRLDGFTNTKPVLIRMG